MIKLIASDMDGTLLNSKSKLSECTVAAIKKAQEAGVQFMIATGRGYNSVRGILDKHDIKCYSILMNGSEIRDPEGIVLMQIILTEDKIRRAVEILTPYGIVINFMTQHGIVSINTEEEVTNDWIDRLTYYIPDARNEEIKDLVKKVHVLENITYKKDLDDLINSGVQVNKIEAFFNNPEKVIEINNKLRLIEGTAVVSAEATSIELTDIKAQKGIILSEYIKEIGITKEEVAVFGDSFNDESLFDEFPCSFAMANSMEGIKEKANKVIDTNDNDGVGKTILEILENQK